MQLLHFPGLVAVFIICVHSSEAVDTLKLVNLVFRHGDRSPVAIYPKDINQASAWPDGLGWLSKIGKQQHYNLGKWLRNRYMEEHALLNQSYIHSQIEVASSNEDRCLMSVYSNLAGMYPPDANQQFDTSVNWQPIPVHTRPEKEDNVINMGMSCPRYDELYNQLIASDSVQAQEKKNAMLYKYCQEKTGYKEVNISSVWKIADVLFCEKSHNMTLNDFANTKLNDSQLTVYERLRNLDAWQFHLMYQSNEMSKLKGGPLLKEMRDNIETVEKYKEKYYGKSMFVFSGHDTTVAALLSALELYQNITDSPPYAACVMLEVYQSENYYYVQILYKDNHSSDPKAFKTLKLKGCEEKCPVSEFLKITKAAVPVNWTRECYTSHRHHSGIHLTQAQIISISLACVLILTLIMLIVTCVRLKRSSAPGYKSFTDLTA